jgi:5-methyltetrahydropteroyltriglutamate--homocysteine methyltransferase
MTERKKPFPTQEIGSLPKFGWRTKPLRATPLDESDIESAREWGERLRVPDYQKLVKLLAKRSPFTSSEKRGIVNFSMLYAILMQERAGERGGASSSDGDSGGLDLVWSGEQARTEMYETPVSSIAGFEFIGRVRSFDNKYWRIASIRKRPEYSANYHMEEFLYVQKHTKRKIKVPITDAITIMAWSDNFHYAKKWSRMRTKDTASARSFNARREFTLDLAKVIRRVMRELIAKGAEEFQIDIPAATQYQTVEDARLVAEAFNETTSGLSAAFSVHSCFPPRQGYALLFPYILEMKKCTRFSFEYANRDSYNPGADSAARPGYADLQLFREYGYKNELGVGVVHVHTDKLPSVKTVRDRILFAAKATDLPPEKLFVNPDCGLRTRRPDVAYAMLGLVVEGAREARETISAG